MSTRETRSERSAHGAVEGGHAKAARFFHAIVVLGAGLATGCGSDSTPPEEPKTGTAGASSTQTDAGHDASSIVVDDGGAAGSTGAGGKGSGGFKGW